MDRILQLGQICALLILLYQICESEGMNILKGVKENQSLKKFAQDFDVLLGSGSFTRRLILEAHSFNFHVFKADINEREFGDRTINSDPADLVQLLSLAKANAILYKLDTKQSNTPVAFSDRTVLLTADQVVVQDNHILEKPENVDQARDFISRYSRNSCSTVGSIALTDLVSRRTVTGVSTAHIHFNEIPTHIIESLATDKICLQCAGGLMIEHDLLQPYISHIDGDIDSVMGLSSSLLEELFNQLALRDEKK